MGGGVVAGRDALIGGRYELEAMIGKGGIAEVWRARHLALNSRVAIKFLQLASANKESALRRFAVEAQVTAQLKTPNAVQVFDFGVTESGDPYLVMELLEGETLGRRLERVKRLSIADTARFLGQAARALQHAHQLGIIHRDFKPDNIVIVVDDEGREQIKVLDFGVAKLAGTLEEDASPDSTLPDGTLPDARLPSFTKTGTVLGTPLYMAPEQIRDASEVDLRTDLWAFGVVAFECLTGRPPFVAATLPELFDRIEAGLHPAASFLEPSVPPGFDAWFDVVCARDPSRRFLNAGVAWKQLVVALGVAQDQSLSLSGGLPAAATLAGVFDANATSAERHHAEVLERSNDGGEFKSLQRIPISTIKPPEARPDQGSSSPIASSLADGTLDRGDRTRRWWMLGGAATLLAGLFAWRVLALPTAASRAAPAWVAASDSTSASAPAPSFRLEVTSTPSDVEVYGNGVLLGRTPVATSIASGSTMHVELRAAGYEPYANDIEPTHDIELMAVLTPLHTPPATTASVSRAGAARPATRGSAGPPSPAPAPPSGTPAASLAPPPPAPPPAPTATPQPTVPRTNVDPLGERQ